MDGRKQCHNFVKLGFCRYGVKCKFSHAIEETELLFSRLAVGSSSRLNQDVQVHLDSNKREELRRLLLNTSFSKDTEKDEGEYSSSESSSEEDDYDEDGDSHFSESRVEKEFDKKYSHIPPSPFKEKFKLNFVGNNKVGRGQLKIIQNSISRDSKLDYNLKEELVRITDKSVKYKQILEFRKKLPAFERRFEILQLIEENQVVVISGETGCGKTTQVAQFILDDYIMKNKGSLCHVVCTQPRRISAISVAERVATERDEPCGNSSVGYQIRLDKSLPRQQGSIVFCTTGILLQWMQSDPGLTTISHVIIDEIHERNINSDFVMTVLRQLLPQRPDLRVILMSATLNSVQFSKYFDNCPTLDIQGHLHAVDVFYLENVLDITSYVREQFLRQRRQNRNRRYAVADARQEEFFNYIVPHVNNLRYRFSELVIDQLLMPESEHTDLELIQTLIEYICSHKGDGAILVFLPGWEQISTLVRNINSSKFFCKGEMTQQAVMNDVGDDDEGIEEDKPDVIVGNGGRFLVLPLHSKLPTVNQSAVFDRPPPGVRKIIVSTNIAETSITIDDVVYIIDSGKMKVKNYDVEKNISVLCDEWVSQANATQRRGRAGRVQHGECYHMYTKARYDRLDKYPKPEILRVRLEDLVLHIKILQLGKVMPFLSQVMSCPNPKTVQSSLKFLQTLNALDEDENLTPLGYHLARLPLDPQIGKMIIMSAIFSCVDPVFSIAACLSEKDPFYIPMGRDKEANAIKLELSQGSKSDHLVFAEGIKRWEDVTSRTRDRKFCRKHFMSGSVLRTLKKLKTEFAESLHEMGFLRSNYAKDPIANLNSDNPSLVKAIICAGLYPNVAIVEKVELLKNLGRVKVGLKTPEDGEVKLHRISINEETRKFESPYLVYHKKLKSSSIFIHDTTMISSLPFVIFGHKFRRGRKDILINDSVQFRCDETLSILVEKNAEGETDRSNHE
ncbi:ATP-dependent DNA/RNA helicase DHX36 isoform X2 [Anabrus simplex]|uniref:ATP-dependent DNA/RNA helicase DHX36 isoform X2 n=1 Tax=Anabrus simplex TaxID=316456 RepID=UPI0035A398F5